MNKNKPIVRASLTLLATTNHNLEALPLNNDEICNKIIYLQRKKAEFLFSTEYDTL